MKIFIDSANLADIEAAMDRGVISGVTTNPSLVAREHSAQVEIVRGILAMMTLTDRHVPLSVEVTAAEPEAMFNQALSLYDMFCHRVNIKIPIGWDELRVVRKLREQDVKVNVTACMSYNQAIMAALAGANYVSLFWGRIRDTGQDAATVVRQVRETFDRWCCESEIIVGSIRQMIDVNEAMQAGADIVTVPPQFLPLLCKHPKTDETVAQFMHDARAAPEMTYNDGWPRTSESSRT